MFRKALMALVILLSLSILGQTVNNGITLFVTKANATDAHLVWVNASPISPPYVYKVYRSEDPTVLGSKIATVSGNSSGGAYDDAGALSNNLTYYYQILHVTE